ncbi:unnamed protein product [Rhodiola kirilowii]
MASNELQNYYYSFDIRESPLEEDDRWDFITVKLRFWKLFYSVVDKSTVAVKVGSRECDIHRVEIADEYDEPILKVSSYLTELGFPESNHATMIARLMLCIDIYIIEMHRYRHETVFLDIKECVYNETTISNDQALMSRSSIDVSETNFEDRQWFCDINRLWPEEADGCLIDAVWLLMNKVTINSNWMQVPWELDDDLEEAVTESLEEYTPQIVPASEEGIASLEKVQQSAVVQCETPSCIICMDEDEDEVVFSHMPCRHVFHTVCVEAWLRINSSCPICRYALPH